MSNTHVNGWPIIARHLAMRAKNQSDLARILQISPAAVTQLKNEQFLLSPAQLNTVTRFLEFSPAAIDEFYSELFTARLRHSRNRSAGALENLRCVVKVEHQNECRAIPVATPEALEGYVPFFEKMDDFMRRNSEERLLHKKLSGSCALRIVREGEIVGVAPGYTLILDSESFPRNGEKVLVCFGDGRMAVADYFREGEKISFLLPGAFGQLPEVKWAPRRQPGAVRWIQPVLECLKSEADG